MVLAILSRLRTMRIFQQSSTASMETSPRLLDKFSEGPPICVTLVQNRFPTEAGLRSFEREELKQDTIVMNRHAPLAIVICDCPAECWPRRSERCQFQPLDRIRCRSRSQQFWEPASLLTFESLSFAEPVAESVGRNNVKHLP